MKKCGEQYRLSRLLKLPEPPGWAMVGGHAVHGTTEFFDFAGDLTPDPALVREKFSELFAEETDNQIKRYEGQFTTAEFHAAGRASKAWPNKEDMSWWLENGPSFVHSWFNYRRVSPLGIARLDGENQAIELHARVEIAGLPVELYIDRVMVDPQGNLIIIDLKSGANMPKDSLQLGIYAEALRQEGFVRPDWGQFFDCRKGVTSLAYDLREWPKARLDYEFGQIRKMQEQGIFLANPSNLCAACGVRRYCKTMGGDLAHTVTQPWETN
jgi:hypothetical protein